MIFSTCFWLATSLSHDAASHVPFERIVAGCNGLADVLEARTTDLDQRSKLARILTVIAHRESRFDPSAVSPWADYGIVQVNRGNLGPNPERLLGDVYGGFDAGVTVLLAAWKQCGTLAKAVGAYETGKCTVTPRSISRCKLAGGCE